jgi:hypothetical protein
MFKFKRDDLVIIKNTIGTRNEVFSIKSVDKECGFYISADGRAYREDEIELWSPMKDLTGGYKMKKVELGKKYKTNDGRSVELIAICDKLGKPVIGIVDGHSEITQWSIDGRKWKEDTDVYLDLVEVAPYADFKVDDKVSVYHANTDSYTHYHFAGIDDNGNALVFANGESSWTTNGTVLYFNNVLKGDL